tara:strand:- start:17388 stop:17540 length:153 start_codon:yes stop_codon:yes gene_type:complete
MAAIIKVILGFLAELFRREIKQDVKASDAETEKSIRDRWRAHLERKLRDD